jgi:uncharacterized protein YndB with AHSA1/START domain
MLEIVMHKTIAAKPSQVWEVLAEHEAMTKWVNVREVVRRHPGTPDPNGVGAVRQIRVPGLVTEERITAFEPGKRLEYAVIKGALGRDAIGEVTLTPSAFGEETLLRWRVSLHPYIPGTGWLISWFLRSLLEPGLERLKERLEPVGNVAFR